MTEETKQIIDVVMDVAKVLNEKIDVDTTLISHTYEINRLRKAK